AGLLNRFVENGECTPARKAGLTRRKTTVHYLESPPRAPRKTDPQAKAKSSLLNPAGSGVPMRTSSAIMSKPCAAFYTEKMGKKQNINMRIAGGVRKNFQSGFQRSGSYLKKSWKWGEEVT